MTCYVNLHYMFDLVSPSYLMFRILFGSCEQAVQGTKEVMTKLAEQDPERDPQDLLSVAVKTFNERERFEGFLRANTFLEGPLTKWEGSFTPKPPMGLT